MGRLGRATCIIIRFRPQNTRKDSNVQQLKSSWSNFALLCVQKSNWAVTDLGNMGPLKALNDTKLILNELMLKDAVRFSTLGGLAVMRWG